MTSGQKPTAAGRTRTRPRHHPAAPSPLRIPSRSDQPAPPLDPTPPDPHPEAPELFTWEFATDPYPAYAWLRENAPVHRTRLPSGVEAWLVTRYADAKQTLADNRLSKNPAHHDEPAHAKGKTGIPGSARPT